MSAAPDYRIRPLTRQEVDIALEWVAREGWNPGLHDAACFYAADAAGFLGGFLGDELVATISVVSYGASFGFLGLYIVKPAHRARGFGLRLWDAGIAHLGSRAIGLDGVVAQQENYRRSGFVLAHRNVRYRGAGRAGGYDEASIVPLGSMLFDTLVRYDASRFGCDRADFLRAWIAQPASAAIGYLHHGELAGYGVVRAARDGFKIGPLFADDATVAEGLFAALVARVPTGAAYCLDVPETNAAAVALAERHRMSVVFETARMYKGTAPAVSVRHVFGVTTFELG